MATSAPSDVEAKAGSAKGGDDVKPKPSFDIPSAGPFSWIKDNLKDRFSLMMLLRCTLATWVCFILILPQPTLRTLGQASFFACIVSIMIPANLPPALWLLANFTLAFGALLGWALGAAAMAAAFRARDMVRTGQLIQATRQSVASSPNPAGAFQLVVFTGRFLDTRSTVVFGVFLCVFAFLFGVMNVKVPKLKLTAIFATIVLDIMCTFGPLLPQPQYTLANIFMKPIGISLGISAACALVVFPTTLSYTFTTSMVRFLGVAKAMLGVVRQSLDAAPSDFVDFEKPFLELRRALVGLHGAMEGQKAFLELEVVRARLSGKDLAALFLKTRVMGFRLLGLNVFHHLVEVSQADDALLDQLDDADAAHPEPGSHPVGIADSYVLTTAMRRIRNAAREQHVDLETLLPVLSAAVSPTVDASLASIADVAEWLDFCNSHRWIPNRRQAERRTELAFKLSEDVKTLREHIRRFEEEGHLNLVKPYERHFRQLHPDGTHRLDAEGASNFRLGARALQECAAFATAFSSFARELLEVVELASTLADKRVQNHVWWPTGLRRLGNLALSKGSNVGGIVTAGGEDVTDGTADDDETIVPSAASTSDVSSSTQASSSSAGKPKKVRPARRSAADKGKADPDALPASNPIHYLGRAGAGIVHFLGSPAGLFGLRYAVATFAVWIVAVVPATAGFSYRNSAIWALIMAQTAIAVSAGEQIVSMVLRTVGTCVGLLLGMMAWYIGSGNGRGNPYGIGAIMAFVFIPVVFCRIFAPPALLMPAIMTGVTIPLVVGYSWQDGAGGIQSASNPGIGYEIAWRRALLVIIGIGVAAVVMVLPRPTSSRALVRKRTATATWSMMRLFNHAVESWAVDEADAESLQRNLDLFRAQYVQTIGVLTTLRTDIGLARFDLALRGKWPVERYEEAHSALVHCFEALGQLAAVLVDPLFEPRWRATMRSRTPILDPTIISDTTACLWIITQSLAFGRALPPATLPLLERTIQNVARRIQTWELLTREGSKLATEQAEIMTIDVLRNPSYMRFIASNAAFLQFIRKVDELLGITCELCGETRLPGFLDLCNDWGQTLETARRESTKDKSE